LHASVSPGQVVTLPLPQLVMSQVPPPAREQSTTQLDPGSHVVWHGGEMHENAQWLPGPQSHMPSQHSPLHDGLFPAHVTWHGPVPQVKSHAAPSSHVHAPSEHVAVHVESGRHSSVHGALAHVRLQVLP
jgi:hypothetical protein